MDSKPSEHVRPRLRRRPADVGTSIHVDDTGKQDARSVASASQAPGLSGFEKNESPSLVGFSKSVLSRGSFKDHGKRDSAQENQSSKVSKSGRSLQNTDIEVFPFGRQRRARGSRKQEHFSQNPVDDAKQQAQKAALLQAQQACATGNFKTLDSQFNNVLIPVIPTQFLSKSKPSFDEAR